MIGRECKYIETGHKGKITKELKGCDKFPDQWGIFWYDGRHGHEHTERNRTLGILNFWQDKDNIEIL
jgi:hypothetical protein